MEEEVNQRVATMMVSTSKMSAGVLARAMQRFLAIECGEWAMYITIGGEYGSGKIYEQDVEKQIECYEKAIEKGIN